MFDYKYKEYIGSADKDIRLYDIEIEIYLNFLLCIKFISKNSVKHLVKNNKKLLNSLDFFGTHDDYYLSALEWCEQNSCLNRKLTEYELRKIESFSSQMEKDLEQEDRNSDKNVKELIEDKINEGYFDNINI